MPNVGLAIGFPFLAAIAVVVGVGLYVYNNLPTENELNNIQRRKHNPGSNYTRRRRNSTSENGYDCVICCGTEDDVMQKLLCSHSFHKRCINTWLNEMRRCPLCGVLVK